MFKNSENNAELKGLGVDSPVIENIQVNKAPKMRCSTYRAHDWINPYVSSLSPALHLGGFVHLDVLNDQRIYI